MKSWLGGKMTQLQAYRSIWVAIANTLEESANLQAKSELMQKIMAIIEQNKWKQAEAAVHCGMTQPRINDLLRGRLSNFSLDALVNIAASMGCKVHMKLEESCPGPTGSRSGAQGATQLSIERAGGYSSITKESHGSKVSPKSFNRQVVY
ncbi:MAG: helix-turn-helix transcriptional regulator (plasmid) [Candidatus Symbiodolus clandestinus]